MNALIDWDDPEWGGRVHEATTDDLGHGRHSEGVSDQ